MLLLLATYIYLQWYTVKIRIRIWDNYFVFVDQSELPHQSSGITTNYGTTLGVFDNAGVDYQIFSKAYIVHFRTA